jgi:hypothetical protein
METLIIIASLARHIQEPSLPGFKSSDPKIEQGFKLPEDIGAPRGRLGGGTRTREEIESFIQL